MKKASAFKYRISFDPNLFYESENVCISLLDHKKIIDENNKQNEVEMDIENILGNKYFTQDKIDEYKEKLIKVIKETKNPFNIYCVDYDCYDVEDEKIFK